MSDKMTEKTTDKKDFSSLRVVHKATCILLVAAAAFIAVCLVTDGMGALGAGIRTLLRGLFSWGAVLIPIALVAQAVCYAEDLATKRFGKRTLFAMIATALISCIDYAVFTWGTEPTFFPVECFNNMNAGGFVGGVIGFVLAKLVGQLGVVIVSVVALAIYSLFFFAEKAGSIGQAALNFVAGVNRAIDFIKDKHQAYVEKKRQIKEDADQHQREVSSEELIDDEFFRAKGEASEVKIKKLGIEENSATHGLSPLVDPEKRIPEEPVIVEEPEIKRRRADKPLDLSYGIEESEAAAEEIVPEVTEEKPAADRAAFGLDDSADSVFTKDFDPFDFATSEKRAAKYASKVSAGSAVTEELDEMTIYQMKADHEPDERERRLMELERRKQEYMRKKQGSQPTSVAESVRTEPVSQPASTTPAAEPTVSSNPEPSYREPTVSTAASNAEAPAAPSVSAHATSSARPTRSQPVKTVEFTISKGPDSERSAPVESAPVSMTVDKPVAPDESAEDIAILISERVARANPAYARSANDLKTYTRVVSDGDEELYRQLEGINSPENIDAPVVTPAPAYEAEVDKPNVEVVAEQTESESEAAEAISEIAYTAQAPANEPEKAPVVEPEKANNEDSVIKTEAESLPESVEFSIGEENHSSPALTAQSTYQRAAGFASAMVNEPATPEFKPYTPPTESITSPEAEAVEESKLRIERSMLPPTPEAVSVNSEAVSAAAAPEVVEAAAPVAKDSGSVEVDFSPVDEHSASIDNNAENDVAEPLFTIVDEEENSANEQSEADGDAVEISFDDDDDDNEDEFDSSDDGTPEEEISDEESGEIPPEEQNPDVIKMRGMFNCLDPIDNKVTSMPAAEQTAEITIPADSLPEENASAEIDDEPPFDDAVEVNPTPAAPAATAFTAPATSALIPVNDKKAEKKKEKPDYSTYEFPSLDLLAKQEEGHDDNIQAEIQENADKLIETLASFGVTASIKGVDRGPRITRYEVVPAKGVKVSSILNLQDDIALNLAAGSIRMEAPIPGKSAVGIEIPNKSSSIVRLRDLLETPDFESAKSKTFVCIGRDVAGQPVFGDLAKMPHLLIAGATGMGKSVCINSLLISVLYKARPDEVKLIMIDPKQVEFTMYNGIPHLLVPVVSDPKQAAGALMWAVEEMERRYNLLNPLCVRNIEAYNEKVTADPSLGDPMPKIIIVIDEFADLMLQVKDPVEQLVTRIAQKARAAGIHLVIGTQRPSVNVITGVIKANVPSRISCKVMSNVDSKTVLDSAGAEKLLDRGDALYAPAGSPKPHRLQCAFVADGEVEAIMNYLKEKSDGTSYDSNVMDDIERAAQKCSKKGGGADRDDDDRDESNGEGYLNDRQFLDAVEIAVNTRKISTSLIQRKLSIGYGKAAKFIDVMEDMGIVGPANGQRPREVMLTPDEWREKLSRSFID